MTYTLKRLPVTSLDAALKKAEHYRDLNQPEEAESICRDVLDVEPENQRAWKLLGLALTDRFSSRHGDVGLLEEAVGAFERLTDEYERIYHVGVAWERSAKAHHERNEAHSAVTAFEHALRLFEKAQGMRPDLPDAVLRWNRCVRLLDGDPALLMAFSTPREDQVRLGD
jgi:tetratricopeptide (TPR) repeat protein